MTTQKRTPGKQYEQDYLASDIEDYVEEGGKIDQCPPPASDLTELSEEDKKKMLDRINNSDEDSFA